MSLYDSLRISSTGLTAERLRLDIIANNIANANTTRTPAGGPYRRQVPVFATKGASSFSGLLSQMGGQYAGQGVEVTAIIEDQSPLKMVYDPHHPDANAEGYVALPNVNIVTEMVDMISATRAYEANVTSINSTKSMVLSALEIGR